jgi:hypothetical protein
MPKILKITQKYLTMKKVLFLLGLTILFLLPTNRVLSNSLDLNRNFWIIDNKIRCINFVNLQALPQNIFLVYLYSPKVAAQLGHPWDIIEENKCYKYNEEDTTIFEIQDITGKERENFKNGRDPSIFNRSNVKKTIIDPFFRLYSPPNALLRFLSILPTKYNFGLFIDYDEAGSLSISEEMNLYVDQLKEKLENLSQEFRTIIDNCDQRKRVEAIITVDYKDGKLTLGESKYGNEWWLLKNNQKFEVKKELTNLEALEIIGCKEAYSRFMLNKEKEIKNIDELSDKLYHKGLEEISSYFGGTQQKYDDKVLLTKEFLKEILRPRERELVASMWAYIKTSNQTNQELPQAFITTNTEQTKTHPINEEPSLTEKIDYVKTSNNPFLKIYFLLPLIALIILFIYYLTARRQ